MGALIGSLGIFLSLFLEMTDEATDYFVAILFYIEGHLACSIITLMITFFPGIMMAYTELRKLCNGKGLEIFKSIGYLFLFPIWSVIIHLYSICDERYAPKATSLKTVEGFLQAGPQFVFQCTLIFRGILLKSVLYFIYPYDESIIAEMETLEILGRSYPPSSQYWFGLIYLLSVLSSFLSIFLTTLYFNEIEDKRRRRVSLPSSLAKLCFGFPFFFFTLVYRSLGISLLMTFFQYWSLIIVFLLFYLNVLTALYIGDDFSRSTAYGLWSLLVPVGYNKDPQVPLGYSLSTNEDDLDFINFVQPRNSTNNVLFNSNHLEQHHETEELDKPADEYEFQIRARYFLTFHILTSILVLGSSLVFGLIGIVTSPSTFFYESSTIILSLDSLTKIFLPVLVLTLGLSILFVRPYFRINCYGKAPKGNLIV